MRDCMGSRFEGQQQKWIELENNCEKKKVLVLGKEGEWCMIGVNLGDFSDEKSKDKYEGE